MNRFGLYICMIIIVISSSICKGQNDRVTDNIIWIVQNANLRFNDKFTFAVKPIIRLKNNYKQLDDASIDFVASYKLPKNFGVSLLNRTFFKPSGGIVNFVFFDLKYNFKRDNFPITARTYLRYHLGVNIDNDVADFWRLNVHFYPNIKSTFFPYIGVEPWLQMDGINDITRVRWKAGVAWKYTNNANIAINYWRQQSYNRSLETVEHMLVAALSYNINLPKRKTNLQE